MPATLRGANDGAADHFFEITTAAAFLAFAEVPAEWVLLETGLGGRLDATNVVAQPRLCLITPVSMDHESFSATRWRRSPSRRPESSRRACPR